jgi:hypothetical protein
MVSKLNSDRKPGEGAGKAISRIYGNIGMKGLFNGLPVRIFMIGTLTGLQWLIYDSFKVYLGVSLSYLLSFKADLSSCQPPEDTKFRQWLYVCGVWSCHFSRPCLARFDLDLKNTSLQSPRSFR